MEYVVRRAEARDIDGLSDLFRDFVGKDSNKVKMGDQLKRINECPQYYVAVADDGNKIVGTAMGIICYDLVGECGTFMLVENVVVAPDHRKLGIGKALMHRIEEFGIENECKYVILVSESKRTESHQFYKSIGYTDDQQGFKKVLK